MDIKNEVNGTSGRYVAELAPGIEAVMTYYESTPGVRVFDHTLVPSAFRGRNIALRLVQAGIASARKEGFRIVPQCSYVALQFRRHPEWSDLLAR